VFQRIEPPKRQNAKKPKHKTQNPKRFGFPGLVWFGLVWFGGLLFWRFGG
jgi:hypothetical protein